MVVFIYEKKNDEYLREINSKEEYLNIIKNSNNTLKKENEDLKKENSNLKKEDIEKKSSESDFTTYYQSMIDLSEVSSLIKEGKENEAKELLLKINPAGFDKTALSFYESLCRELKI